MASKLTTLFVACLTALWGCADAEDSQERADIVPVAQWDNHPQGALWTDATLLALSNAGEALLRSVPSDISTFCPAYPDQSPDARAAFWTSLLSALAGYESTWNPDAVGGGGRWYGLVQIAPATARGYGCAATTGEALKSGEANLSCAIRIWSQTVIRDNAVALSNGRRAGIAADWGPMTQSAKRADMAAYTRSLSYCE